MVTTFDSSFSPAFLHDATVTPAPTFVESQDGAWVFSFSAKLTNAIGEVWTLTSRRQIAVNGRIDTITNDVMLLHYQNHQVYQMNGSGNWFSKSVAKNTWVQVANPVANS